MRSLPLISHVLNLIAKPSCILRATSLPTLQLLGRRSQQAPCASLALAARLQQGFPAQMSPGTTANARYDMQAVLAARLSLLTVT